MDIAGERLPGLGRWPIELRHAASHVLHGRTVGLFKKLLDAELVWAHAKKQLEGVRLVPFPHPDWVFGALLVLYAFFGSASRPESLAAWHAHEASQFNKDSSVLHRVEDLGGPQWGLQFEEADAACGPHHDYSINECGPRLIRANATLTPRNMLTWSDSLGIWGWGGDLPIRCGPDARLPFVPPVRA